MHTDNFKNRGEPRFDRQLAAGAGMPNNLKNQAVVNGIISEAKNVIESLRRRAYLLENETPD